MDMSFAHCAQILLIKRFLLTYLLTYYISTYLSLYGNHEQYEQYPLTWRDGGNHAR